MSERVRRLAAVVPDGIAVAVFLGTWVAPLAFGLDLVGTMMSVMLLEFLAMHSGVFMGSVLLRERVPRLWKTLTGLGLGAFYLFMVLVMANDFGQPWMVGAFAWLIASRVAAVWLVPVPAPAEKRRQESLWMVSILVFLAAGFFTALLPVPALGVSEAVVAELGRTNVGLWVDEPQRALAFGALYFAVLGGVKWRWFGPGTSSSPH